MDNKTWLWRKRSSEKTIVAITKSDFSSKGNEEEMLPTEKEISLLRSLETLDEKLASVLCESNAKDDLLSKHANMAEEAIKGREKAEAAAVSLKQELDKALQQNVASNERLTQLNAALKESMQQSTSLREEHEQRIRDAVMKTSREFENKRLANLTVENTRLSKTLLMKEKLIEELSKRVSQAEAEFNTLMARLDSIEKENAFLKYEFRMLENQLEIRNEEIEFNRQSADVSHKQHMESVNKIKKLERLPGPAALAKMKNEVESQGRNQSEMRRKLNPVTGSLIVRDSTLQNPPDMPNKKISFLIERLCDMEEENKKLKEILSKRDDELHSSQIVEVQLGELSKRQKSVELSRCSPIARELFPTPSFGISNDETNHSEPWASALISELDCFKNQKPKNPHEHTTFGVSDMSLMDDFVEMEKLAIVTVGTPLGTSCASPNTSIDSRGKELVPVLQRQSTDIEQEIQTKDVSTEKGYDWLQNVLNLILDQTRTSKRSFDDLLDDIRIALTHEDSKEPGASYSTAISGYITWKSPNTSPRVGPLNGVPRSDTSVEETSSQHIQPNLSRSILKIIELIRRMDLTCSKNCYVPDNGSERDWVSDYLIHVFQWRSAELSTVLQQFVYTCDDLLDGKAKFENFAAELASALDWIINQCIISQDVSCVRDKINKHLGSYNSPHTGELDMFEMEKTQSDLREENKGLKDKFKTMESLRKELEAGLRSANDKNESLMNQLRESEQSIGHLQSELKTLKESKGIIEDQIENQKLINEDLDTQLNLENIKLNEVLQKLSTLEVELEDKSHCCEELEATCLELQLQMESVTNKEAPKESIDQEERLLKTGWEITTASAKLAECQETILHLGKQLKALASPRETSVFNNVSTTATAATAIAINNMKKLSQRSSLRDRMLADDLTSPKTRQIISTIEATKPSFLYSNNFSTLCAPSVPVAPPEVGSLAIVPSKKRGGVGFLRKLLLRKKRGSSKKTSRSFAA
ncbi:Filament-like plant protein 7 [Camellia lanceoleosa]|uniref:Filament-like plant protein 7 n=1 Tax=Camellia lanceoleosa TaxID=1840588 RepID=A0ACC0IS81_9ERIC|nr:Filament-like plant protein 7 [Camellia lanceoleosa]